MPVMIRAEGKAKKIACDLLKLSKCTSKKKKKKKGYMKDYTTGD